MRTKDKKTAASIKEANKEHLIELSKALARNRSEAYHIENIIDAIVEDTYEDGEFDRNRLEHNRLEQLYLNNIREFEAETAAVDKARDEISSTSNESDETSETPITTNETKQTKPTKKATKKSTKATNQKGALTPHVDSEGTRIRLGDEVKILNKGRYKSKKGVVHLN